jgi:hypothetical protein
MKALLSQIIPMILLVKAILIYLARKAEVLTSSVLYIQEDQSLSCHLILTLPILAQRKQRFGKPTSRSLSSIHMIEIIKALNYTECHSCQTKSWEGVSTLSV